MTKHVDLNCDMGESFGAWRLGQDEALLELVSSANIACGWHAGDPATMARTVQAAAARGVALGAHPGLPDLQGFGRRNLAISAEEARGMTLYQVGALDAFARAAGSRLRHVKPHGALNNLAAVDAAVARAVARAIKAVDAGLIFLAPAGSAMVAAGRSLGLAVAEEVFADRNYDDAGNLVPRSQPQAMIHDPAEAAAHVLRMVREGTLRSVTGRLVPCRAQSVCVHGDDAGAVALARHLRDALAAAGIAVVPLAAMIRQP